MADFVLDWRREERTGAVEAVYCASKSPAQIAAILDHAHGLERRLLLTRLTPERVTELPEIWRDRLDFDPVSGTAVLGGVPERPTTGRVAVVSGGTSDAPVVGEAARALAFHGEAATVIADVGVAGLWRLMERIEEIRRHRVVIAVAGMEGALFSVLGGLVARPVIAVPTSVGYGVAAGGNAALTSALASCAGGLVAVNIDNGLGAAYAALRILRSA